jgi:hypothetical protein
MESQAMAAKHIELSQQREEVKQFFRTLHRTEEGSVVELDGHAVARLLPVTREEPKPAGGEEWTDAKNARRCGLIDKEIAGTLSPAEAQELDRLQRDMLAYRDRVAPWPLAEARRLHQELLHKAAAANQRP